MVKRNASSSWLQSRCAEKPMLKLDSTHAIPGAAITTSALRCRTSGRLRNFIRQRILLSGWQPRLLPIAASDEIAGAALSQLVGNDLLREVNSAISGTDDEARQVGGCARDAYTVLYACAGLAVLLAASGVAAPGNNLVLNLLVFAELIMLMVLLLTFRKAHRVNWHQHWLALRYHVEFLRVLPILGAVRLGSLHALLTREGLDSGLDISKPDAPHLAVLNGRTHRSVDLVVSAQMEAQRLQRAGLYAQLNARFQADPAGYVANATTYAQLIAGQQLRYHCMRAQQEQTIVHRAHQLSMIAFGVTIVAVVVHFWWHAALLTIIGTGVPAFVASLHGFVAQEESERLASSYTSMAIRLEGWLALGESTGEMQPTQERLGELAELLLSEVQDWHRLFGEKGMYHLG